MNKIFALFRNEWTKVLRKRIIYIIMSLIIIGIVILGVFFKVFTEDYTHVEIDFSEVKKDIEAELEIQNTEIENQENSLEMSSPENRTTDENYNIRLEELENSYRYRNYLELALENEVNIYNPNYRSDIISELANLYFLKENISEGKTGNLSKTEIENQIEELDHALQSDFASYIEYQIKSVNQNQTLTEQQKELKISDLKLEVEINPEGQTYYPTQNYFANLINTRDVSLSTITNKHHNFSPLTATELQNAKKDFAISNYYLSRPITDLPETESNSNYFVGLAVSLGQLGMIFLIAILAGSTISQEISTGSIKGLIIAPVKRNKIFYAKLANIISVSFLGMLVVYLVTLISSYIFIEPFYRLPYAFITHSGVQVIQFPLYLLILCLVKVSSVIMIGFIALMFSSTTRNTAISVGVSIVFYFGLITLYNFIKTVLGITHTIMIFLPFEYLDLAKYILPPIYGITSESVFIFGYNPSVEFVMDIPTPLPYLYWLIMAICLIWIARDSFVKRDF